MSMLTLFMLLLCACQCAWVQGNYFCNFKCGSKHTACRRKHCRVSRACSGEGKMLPLSDKERQHVLDLHNDYRNRIALGIDKRAGNTGASNMRALNYDKELEFVAQCWANACKETGKTHDVCRTTKKFYYVGQNMMGGRYSVEKNLLDIKILTWAVKMWYEEIDKVEPEEVDSYNGDLQIGHFTQVVWAKTTHIGCGRAFGVEEGSILFFFYCNYGIGGNMIKEPVYIRGKPCSDCKKERCNARFSGLCGQLKRLSEDKWQPPFVMGASTVKGTLIIVLVMICMLIK